MDTSRLHDLFIIVHAALATLSFFAGGALVFWPRFLANRRLFGLYAWSLVGMVVLLVGALIAYWTRYSTPERIIFPGLLVLDLYMLYRARRASALLRGRQNAWEYGYMGHIGFTIISLFEGFVIVAVLNAGGAAWLVAVLAILGVLGGRWAIHRAQGRVMP